MKLTDNQKRDICKLFYSGEKTKADLAKSFNVSHTTISKILNDEKVAKSFKNLNSEITTESQLSMLAFLDSKKSIAQDLISEALSSIKGKIQKASLKDTVAMIEKLSTVFDDRKDEQDSENEEIAVKLIIQDVSGGEPDD